MNIPRLRMEQRKQVCFGADFMSCVLMVSAPALPPEIANRFEVWKRLNKRQAAKRWKIENYVQFTNSDGTKGVQWFWEDNSRLAAIDGQIFELVESKSVKQWR